MLLINLIMNNILTIEKSIAKGEVTAPPSKSMAHRVIISSCLSKGKCEISNISYSEDIKATINLCKILGAEIECLDDKIIINSEKFLIDTKNEILNCNESGSTLRFFIPLCLLDNKKYVLTGSDVLMHRPLDEYQKLCKEYGFIFDLQDNLLTVSGKLKTGIYHISSTVSSQFATGLMFALSYLDGESKIVFDGEINSKSYIEMTIDVLNDYGINASFNNNEIVINGNTFTIKNNIVEADMSNTAFLDSFNFIGGNVKINGINKNTLQGDRVYIDYFNKINEGYCEIDIKDTPDLAPILITLSALKDGCILTHTNRLKVKESDRGLSMKTELAKCNVDIEILDDQIIIKKSEIKKPNMPLDSNNDHRIAMALTVFLSTIGGSITGYNAVNKSFPSFYELIKKLGVIVNEV